MAIVTSSFHLPSQNMQAVLRTQLNKQLESCELHLIEGQMDCRLAVRLESMQGIYLPQRDSTNLRWILTSPLVPRRHCQDAQANVRIIA